MTASGKLISRSSAWKLLAIFLLGLLLRLALLPLVQNPGLHDALHYSNLGRRLVQGQGFSIDYVWHYSRPPSEIVQPIDHWMPMAGIAAALGMALAGEGVHAALALFLLVGTGLPLLAYMGSKQLQHADSCALMAAAFAALLPEIVLNSLRTDSTILNMLFLPASVLLLQAGLRAGRARYFVLCGAILGCAYLTRNDSIILLPILVAVSFIVGGRVGWRFALLQSLMICLAFLLVLAPWLLRNIQAFGQPGSPLTAHMPFMIQAIDHYAYGIPITLESMLARQSPAQMLEWRLFELAAAFKQMGLALQLPLVILVPAGLGMLLLSKDRRRIQAALPTVLWIIAILLIYPLLIPVLTQGGSFKKAFLSIVPLLLPFGAAALWRILQQQRYRILCGTLILGWLAFTSVDLVRQDTQFADTYHRSISILLEALRELPDRTGDGELRLMSQDPFVLSYNGFASIMTPFASREGTLALARRYHIDYLQLPGGRPALDPLYLGEAQDARFELAAHVADAGAKPYELYRFVQTSE